MKRGLLAALPAAAILLMGCTGEPEDAAVEKGAPLPTAVQQYVLTIEGMTCQNCVNTMERVLARCPGVAEVTVDLDSAKGVVKGEGMQASDLTQAVEKAGYQVTGVEGPTDVLETTGADSTRDAGG